jgi:hypothetical protein
MTDVKTAWSLELYKSRMATYPDVHRALAPLSHTATVTPEAAGEVARQLNEWIYSAGGLCVCGSHNPRSGSGAAGMQARCPKIFTRGGT